jgi:hypothetical protein
MTETLHEPYGMRETGSREKLLNAAVLHWMHDLAAQGIFTTDNKSNVVEWNHWMEEHTEKRAKGRRECYRKHYTVI